MGYKFERELDL